ncbi:hypothetical protein ABIF65_009538 [Bradyrhizobium japonicum]
MIINYLAYNDTTDPSFLADEKTAVDILEATIADNITVNIKIGYGDFNGITLPDQTKSGGDVNQSIFQFVDYATLQSDLEKYGQPGFFNSTNLPSDPGQSNFWISSAEAKIFGISTPLGAIDGYVGIGTSFTPGAERVAALLHEITHALGRVPENQTALGSTYYSALDLWRFTSTDTRLWDGTTNPTTAAPVQAAWFSVTGGTNPIRNWGMTSDPSDFLYPTSSNDTVDNKNDPFNESVSSTDDTLTSADLQIMDALGFTTRALPNLEIDSLTPTGDTVTVGESISVGAAVHNYGPGAAGSFSTRIYISADSTFNSNATLLATFTTASLASDAIVDLNQSVNVPNLARPIRESAAFGPD